MIEPYDPQKPIKLSPRGLETLSEWAVVLTEHGYDLRTPTDVAQAAAFLLANGWADEEEFGLDSVRVLLAFASGDRWDDIKAAASGG